MQRAVFVLLSLALWAAPAAATELRIKEQPGVLFEDQAGRLVVELLDPKEQVDSLELKGDARLTLRGPLNGGKQTHVVNGVMSVSYVFYWEVTPPRGRGDYPLGPLVMKTASGKTERLEVAPVRVVRRPPAGGKLLVEPERTSGPAGHPVRVLYTLLSGRPRYEGGMLDSVPYGLTALEVAPLDAKGLRVEAVAPPGSEEASRLTLRSEHELVVRHGLVERDGFGYYATRFALLVKPLQPGPVDLSCGARLLVKGGVRRVRTLFGVRNEAERVEVTLSSQPVTYTAEALPAQGQPPGFAGAVGNFRIEAACEVKEANAFDPIEVTVTVRAETSLALEGVRLPDWSAVPEIDAAFQVAKDVDPGTLNEDGSKTFTKVFRARSAEVQAIPALPFPYYDADARAYRVVRSQPIPIAIAAVRTVDADDALGAGPTTSVAGAEPEAIASLVGVGANFTDVGETQPALVGVVRLDAPLLLVGLAPPLLLLLVGLGGWARARAAGGPKPLARALAGLAEADGASGVREVLQAYGQERLGLEGGELTPAELEQALRARVVPPELIERAVSLWEALDRARFAGGEVPAGADALLRELDPCL